MTFARADPDEAALGQVLGAEPFRTLRISALVIGPVRLPNTVRHRATPAIPSLLEFGDAGLAKEAGA